MSNFIKKFRDNNGNEFPLDFNSLRNFPTLQAGQVLKVTAVDADGQPADCRDHTRTAAENSFTAKYTEQLKRIAPNIIIKC